MKKKFAAIAAFALVLSGCSPQEPTQNANQGDSDPATGVTNPDAVVNLGFLLEPSGIDPTTVSGAALDQLVDDNVYEGLVRRMPSGDLEPTLAESWDVSDDGLTYTFNLRQGVQFHDGSDFDAADVVATLEASSAEDSKNPDAKLMHAFESATEIDEKTVEVRLKEKDINFLEAMGSKAAMMVPSDNEVDLTTESNGTGPFRIGEWQTGNFISLERNDDYWGEQAGVKEAVFNYYDDISAAANALASGQIDILTSSDADTRSRFEGDSSIQTVEGDDTAYMTLAFNHENEALQNKDVRSAIRLGIDKNGLIDALGTNATRIGSMVSPAQAWWDESLNEIDSYDPEAARALLQNAGFEDLSLNLRVANQYDPAVSEYIASQLGQIGINVDIQPMEFSAWLDQVYQKKEYDMTMVLQVDPWTLTYYGNPKYYWNYDNAEAQQLTDEALSASSFDERDEKLGELARFVSEDAASEWLYSPKATQHVRQGVSGFPTDRIGSRYYVADITVED